MTGVLPARLPRAGPARQTVAVTAGLDLQACLRASVVWAAEALFFAEPGGLWCSGRYPGRARYLAGGTALAI